MYMYMHCIIMWLVDEAWHIVNVHVHYIVSLCVCLQTSITIMVNLFLNLFTRLLRLPCVAPDFAGGPLEIIWLKPPRHLLFSLSPPVCVFVWFSLMACQYTVWLVLRLTPHPVL